MSHRELPVYPKGYVQKLKKIRQFNQRIGTAG